MSGIGRLRSSTLLDVLRLSRVAGRARQPSRLASGRSYYISGASNENDVSEEVGRAIEQHTTVYSKYLLMMSLISR